MTFTLPSDTHAVGDSGHTSDHNSIVDSVAAAVGISVQDEAYAGGAKGDGSTDDYAAFAAAVTAAAVFGAPVYVPPTADGYGLSETLTLPANVNLAGAGCSGTATVGYLSGSFLKPLASFTGTSVIYIPDSGHAETNGAQVRHLGINGSAQTSSAVDGIQMYGPVLAAVVDDVRIIYMSGWGLNFVEDTVAGETTEAFPFGLEISNVYVDTCGQGGSAGGINAYWCEDSTFINCYVIGNDGPGWVVQGCDNTKFIGCRSEWNGTYGFHVTGDWSYASTGPAQYIGISTDRNQYDGVYIDATWTADGDGTGPCPQLFTNASLHRDGAAGGSTYAGLRTSGTSLPVIVSGIAETTGDNDGGGGNMSPYYGVKVSQSGTAPFALNGGLAWGDNTAISVAGTNAVAHGYWPVTGPAQTPAYGSYVT